MFLVKKIFNKTINPFIKWNWSVFLVLLVWFVAQNSYVEVFIYHLQLGISGDLSWGPLMPFGSYFNPTLFEISGRPVTFQSQLTWVLMTPIIYFLTLYFNNKTANSNV